MEIKANAKFVKTAPRKIKLVADFIRGKKLIDAINILQFTPKQASKDLLVLLHSARSNAKQKNADEKSLTITEIFVGQGEALKRQLLHSRGRASQIKKRMSNVSLVLSDELKPKVKSKNKNPRHSSDNLVSKQD